MIPQLKKIPLIKKKTSTLNKHIVSCMTELLAKQPDKELSHAYPESSLFQKTLGNLDN